jgi:hypothetical protein
MKWRLKCPVMFLSFSRPIKLVSSKPQSNPNAALWTQSLQWKLTSWKCFKFQTLNWLNKKKLKRKTKGEPESRTKKNSSMIIVSGPKFKNGILLKTIKYQDLILKRLFWLQS